MKKMHAFTIRHCLFMGAIIALLAGCDNSPRLPPLPQQAVILAFGDSLTQGVGAGQQHSYPSVLSGLAGRQVINAGVSGEETAGGLARLPGVLDETRPALLILMEGGNDILRGRDLQQTRQHLAEMIELAQSRDIAVLLIGVPEKKLFSSLAPLYTELAEQYQLPLEANVIGELMRSPRYKSDAVHFNREGYRVLAERIHTVLVENGAL